MTHRRNFSCIADHLILAIGGIALLLSQAGCVGSAPGTPVHIVPVGDTEPGGDSQTSTPATPALVSTLQQAVGMKGPALTQLLMSLGFSNSELEREEICGEGPTALTGGLESVQTLSANLDQDPEDEWIVWLSLRLDPAAPTPDPPPLRGMPRAVVVLDRAGPQFNLAGRWLAGSVLTRDFEVSVAHVHDATAADLLIVETFDACLADPRDVLMRDHTLLTTARGPLEAIWNSPSSRQGPWAGAEETPPASPVFEGVPPKTITCASCYFRSRSFRFDSVAFRYVEVRDDASNGG